jgi:hypothetical protein
MKKMVKRALQPAFIFAKDRIKQAILGEVREACANHQEIQRNIVNQYLMFRNQKMKPYNNIKDAGFRVYSEFEEDGIILYILSMIGFKTRRVVEMCCGSADVCMATNLILNHGFDGYLFDGSQENISAAKGFFRSKKDCILSPPALTHAWITAENVNDLLSRSGCAGEVDVFSLDIDGNDYWIWNAIEAINPRLLVFETNPCIPSDKSLAIEYQADFDSTWPKMGPENHYRGASLLAWQRLCKRRGYRMIGAHRYGFNVFFLREDEDVQFFPEIDVDEILNIYIVQCGQTQNWPLLKDMPWKEVEMAGNDDAAHTL